MAVTILPLIDEAKCFQMLRELGWPEGAKCPHCQANTVAKRGFDDTQKHRQRYHCNGCDRDFDDLTRTVFAGHHQPLQVWLLCLYFMGLNLSNARIAIELGLDPDSVHQMATTLREGVEEKSPEVVLSGVVEFDEVYVVAGHKGHPDVVKKRAKGTSASFEECSRSQHIGERKAAGFWDDSTLGRCGANTGSQRAAKDHRPHH